MSKKNRCYLCGGKLSGGYCHACGLDNTRQERAHYHLNESNAARRIEANIEETPEPEKEKTKKSRSAKEKSIGKIRPAEGKGAGTFRSSGRRESGKTSGIDIRHVKLLVSAGIIIIVIAGAVVNGIEEHFQESSSVYYEDEITYETDPYQYAEYELSEDGEFYETELEPGEYVVGVHLPEGTYLVELMDGNGSFNVSDYTNSIYLWEYFGEEEDYEVTGVTDVRLYTGAKLNVNDNVKLKFTTENGQTEKMDFAENPLAESVTLTQERMLTAGLDFEAGVYDAEISSGWATLDYEVPTDAEYVENGVNSRTVWLDASGRDRIYHNIVLPAGTTISTDAEEKILLTPSKYIGTMGYAEYYDLY